MGANHTKVYSEDGKGTERTAESSLQPRSISTTKSVKRLQPKWKRRRFVVGFNNEEKSFKMRVVKQTSASLLSLSQFLKSPDSDADLNKQKGISH